jgi:hypothetical protein
LREVGEDLGVLTQSQLVEPRCHVHTAPDVLDTVRRLLTRSEYSGFD